MRLLLITQWFPPEPQNLLLELATTLRELGHDVTVLTGLPNYPTGRLYPGYKVRLCQEERIDGIRVIRVPLYPDHSRSALKRTANFLSFALSSALLGPFVTPRVDAIHVIHPPPTVALAAWIVSRWQRIPFTYEVQDMWPETLCATGMVTRPWMLQLVTAYVNWVYSKAARIRVISPGFKANLMAKGVDPAKIRVISNWVDTNFYRPVAPAPALREELGLSGRFVVIYAGTIGPAQGLATVVQAAAHLQGGSNCFFAVFGDGIDREALAVEASARGLTNIRFYGQRKPTEMSAIYALADVLLIHLKDDPLFRITIPHKTFVYMAAEKPILAAVAGDVASVVEGVGAGVVCPPGDPEALAEKVRQLEGMASEALAAMGVRGRRAAETTFGRRKLVGELSAMITEAATQASRRET